MKRFESLLLGICCIFLLLSCAKEPEAVVINVTGGSANPASLGETPAPEAGAAEAVPQGTPRLKLLDTVAYAFGGAEGPVLYGAVSYENAGTAPLRPTKATFNFTFEGKTQEVGFVPVFADKTIVRPGETAFAVLWYAREDVPIGAEVRLSASLEWEATTEDRIPIEVSGLRLAHNYPAFSTMSGALTAGADCPCNLVYTAFYDQSSKLLGVWYFTENAYLLAGKPKAFTSHLREFPLADLAEQAEEIRSFGIGMQ